MNKSLRETMSVALFPIPGMVGFPGLQMPLHVFEPRYRAMIKYCLDENMMLAVAHTKKTISEVKKMHNNENPLNKNQATYEPHSIFSAGYCELLEQTGDGRLYINVAFKVRLVKQKVIQEVPFQIISCEELGDEENDNIQSNYDTMDEIYELVSAICKSQSPELLQIIEKSNWQDLSPKEFSFLIFQYFKFDADFMQQVLEQTSTHLRLKLIWDGLTRSLMN